MEQPSFKYSSIQLQIFFAEYAYETFIPYIFSQLRNALHLDLVSDRYIEDSLKSTARAMCGKGIRRHVVAEGAIPSNWHDFVCVAKNKTEVFRFLSMMLSFQRKNNL